MNANAVDDIINNAAKEPKSKKKSDVPTLDIEDTKIGKQIVAFKENKIAEKSAKAKQALAAEVLIPVAKKFHEKSLKGVAEVPSTVKLVYEDQELQVDVAKKQYSAVSMDDQPLLVKTFGKKADDFFERKLSISLTDAAIADKEILAKLIKAVGAENFAEYFNVSHTLAPTPAFHSARFLDSTVKTKAGKLIDEGIIKPYSPALR